MPQHDPDRSKGAVEQDKPGEPGNTSLTGQLGHRNKGPAKAPTRGPAGKPRLSS